MTPIKIASRDSLLAQVQAKSVIRALLERHPERLIDHVTLKTTGDLQTQAPLWQLDGKNFFTKELDDLLLDGRVDAVVHSLKDLSTERPKDFTIAAIPPRALPHDVLLVRREIKNQLHSKSTFIVGTSSPRRLALAPTLAAYLPRFHGTIDCIPLRGNVPTRIEKLRRGDFDGIILALAGLERLAPHLDWSGLDFIILPVSIFTPAAGQGALAIECVDSSPFRSLFAELDDPSTRQAIAIERQSFASYGGGCHLAIGIHARHIDGYTLEIHRGEHNETRWPSSRSRLPRPIVIPSKEFLFATTPLSPLPPENHVFATSTHTLPFVSRAKSLWVSGETTFRLAVQEGHWVHGSADGWGHAEIQSFQRSAFIKAILPETSWSVLSHDRATSPLGECVACYERHLRPLDSDTMARLESAQSFFWSSIRDYDALVECIPSIASKHHACGLGKTLDAFRSRQIPVTPFPSLDFFMKEYSHE